MKWLSFVSQFRQDNPHMSFKAALKACSEPFKKHKKKLKYTEPKVKLEKKVSQDVEDCGCYSIHKVCLKKSMRDKLKSECGINKRKTGIPKKTIKFKTGSGSSKRRKAKPAKQTSRK